MPYNVLIVDDDVDHARSLQLAFKRYGDFDALTCIGGVEALRVIRRSCPDLVVLDVMMPGLDGHQVCTALRADPQFAELPIIFVTARGEPEDRIEGFRLGADDYIAKLVHPEELVLRARAVLRRAHGKQADDQSGEWLVVGDVRLNTQRFTVTTPTHEDVLLTPVEYDLMYHLMVNAGTVFSCERLLQEVWGYVYETGSPDLVRMHIRNLRRKIEDDPTEPVIIRTVPRYGYTIDAVENSDDAGQAPKDARAG
jgi:DNA-binding response OmpR family regulator